MPIKMNNFILMLLLMMTVFITGCWDYTEIDDQIIISGVAADYDQENKEILLTAEITLPTSSGKESNFSSKTYQGKGRSVLDAVVDLRSKAGRKLLWSHMKVLILSKDFMDQQKLFIGIMDWIKRNHEVRDTIWLIVSKEKTAGEIFLKSNPQTQKIISAYLDALLSSQKSETFLSVPFSKFIGDLQSLSKSAALPIVGLENSSNGTLPLIEGTALFKQTKEIGRLDGKQTRTLLLLMNRLKQAVFAPEPSDVKKVKGVSLQMDNCQTAIKPVIGPKGLIMMIHIKIEAEIGEVDGEQDVFKTNKMKELVQAWQEIIEGRIRDFLQTLQKNYQCDAIGFGNKVEANLPNLWKKTENRWLTEYAKTPIEIRLKLTVPGSQESMKVTKVGI